MISKEIFSNKRSRKFVMNPGSPIKEMKHGVIQGDGTIRLVVDDVKDIQQEINSYERSTDIYNIINKMTPGDEFMYADQAREFFDATDMPKTYAEALQLIIDGQNRFEKLPVDIKMKFDNDFNKWFATAGSNEWLEKHGFVENKETATVQVEEVKE